jgi:hypothetical protein
MTRRARLGLLAPSRFLIVACGWLALTLSAAGCKQGTGERCEFDGDCVDGDLCDKGGNTTNPNGICVPKGTVVVPDSGTPPVDSGAPDAEMDLMSVDAPPEAAAADASSDLSTSDTGTD